MKSRMKPTIQIFVGRVSFLNLDCSQMDTATALQNGNLEEGDYVKMPAKIRAPCKPNLVFRPYESLV